MTLDFNFGLSDVFTTAQKIVVLAPHPDDETLACAGLLARAFRDAGAHVFCLTDGSASHPNSDIWGDGALAALRRQELSHALRILGGTDEDLTWLGLRDSQLYKADVHSVAADLSSRIDAIGARHVFAPALEDHHADHKATALIAQALRSKRPEWEFCSYPVWSRWDDPMFAQTILRHDPVFLPADDTEQKRNAVAAHQSQLGLVVEDDPEGFVLPAEFVEKFVTEDEVFWRMP